MTVAFAWTSWIWELPDWRELFVMVTLLPESTPISVEADIFTATMERTLAFWNSVIAMSIVLFAEVFTPIAVLIDMVVLFVVEFIVMLVAWVWFVEFQTSTEEILVVALTPSMVIFIAVMFVVLTVELSERFSMAVVTFVLMKLGARFAPCTVRLPAANAGAASRAKTARNGRATKTFI